MSKLVFGGDDVVDIKDIDPSVRPIVEMTDTMLSRKRSQNGEIIVTLFEHCNLSCKFCNQDHESTFGMDADAILCKFGDITKAITLLRKMRKETFSVHFMGGELFQDSISDEMFAAYQELALNVWNWATELHLELNVTFVSNFVHFNTARVKALVDELRAHGVPAALGTSYDPSMRFSAADLIVFRKNLEIYKDYIGVVNVVLTAPNIRKFLSGNIPHFDYIYENFETFFDYYTPEANHEIMSPKDHELRDMFVWLAQHYPNAHPISGWMNNETNAMSCQSTYTIMPDGKAGRCTILLNNFQKQVAPKTAGEMEGEFITKMDCLSCEYFSRCGLGCFLQQHFNGPNRTMNDCWMKDVHKKISEVKRV